MLEQLIIHMILGVIASVVKNPAKKAQLQTALLEIRDAITELYPDTPAK